MGGVVGFLLQRLALDLELHDAAIEFVQRLGLAIDGHAQARRRLVHQIDGLVGQEAVGDVAVGKRCRAHQGRIGNADAVMQLVFFLEAAQDRDGVFHRRFVDEHRLEATGQGRVLFDIFAVLVQRRRAHAMQLAARQSGLEQIGGIHGAIGLAGAHQRVHLVDEKDDLPIRGGDLVEHGLQPLLEFAAIFRAGNERAHVERQQRLVLEAFGHVAIDDADGQALGDGGLADAGLADQHRIVLGAAGQDLDGAADFLVAADDRVELAFAHIGGQVARIFLERVIGVFGRSAIGGAALADFLDGGIEPLRGHADRTEDLAGIGIFFHHQRQQQPLDGDETVAGLLRCAFGGVEHPRQFAAEIKLRAVARNRRDLGDGGLDGCPRRLGVAPGALDQTIGHALVVVQQHLEQVDGGELLMAAAQRQGLRALDEAARPLGVFFDIHATLLVSPASRPIKGIVRRRKRREMKRPDRSVGSTTRPASISALLHHDTDVSAFGVNKRPCVGQNLGWRGRGAAEKSAWAWPCGSAGRTPLVCGNGETEVSMWVVPQGSR